MVGKSPYTETGGEEEIDSEFKEVSFSIQRKKNFARPRRKRT